jgi:hypothetical protein
MAEFATREAAKQDAIASAAGAAGAAPGPVITVLTGPNTGRTIPLNSDETLIGRVGLQVAAVRKGADGFRLFPVEGAAPQLNGVSVPRRDRR